MKSLRVRLAALMAYFFINNSSVNAHPPVSLNFSATEEVPVRIQHGTFIFKTLISLSKSPNTVIVSGTNEVDKIFLDAMTKHITKSRTNSMGKMNIVGIQEQNNVTEIFQLVKRNINSLIEKYKVTDVFFISANDDDKIIYDFITQVVKCYQTKLLHFVLLSGSQSAKITDRLQPHLYEEMNLVLLILRTKYISCYQVLVNRQGVSCLRYLGREKPDYSETCKNLSFLHDKHAQYKDFNGRTLTISAMTVSRPVLLGFKNASFISVNIAGFDVPYIKILEEKFNMRTKLIFTPTGNGLIELLTTREADFTTKLHFNYERSLKADLCFPHFTDSYLLFMKVPKELSKSTVLFRLFPPLIWAVVIGTTIAIGITFSVFFVIADIILSGHHQISEYKDLIPILGAGQWYSFLVLMEETSDTKATKTIKFLSLLWSVLSLVITVAYSGLLFSYLTSPQNESPIDTLPQAEIAVKEGGWKLSVAPKSAMSNVFEKAKSGFCKRMWDVMKLHNWGVPFGKTFEQQEKEDRVMTVLTRFILPEKFMLYYGYKYRICKEPILSMASGSAVRKGCPYQDHLSTLNTRIRMHGVLQYLQDRIVKPKFHIEEPANFPLNLQHLQSGFFVLILGLTLASLIFLGTELNWKTAATQVQDLYNKQHSSSSSIS